VDTTVTRVERCAAVLFHVQQARVRVHLAKFHFLRRAASSVATA
jgi:hypothetical protein